MHDDPKLEQVRRDIEQRKAILADMEAAGGAAVANNVPSLLAAMGRDSIVGIAAASLLNQWPAIMASVRGETTPPTSMA